MTSIKSDGIELPNQVKEFIISENKICSALGKSDHLSQIQYFKKNIVSKPTFRYGLDALKNFPFCSFIFL